MFIHQDAFRGVAQYYAKYRRGYPDEFYKRLKQEFSLTKESRALDAGTGTGQIAFSLAKIVSEVVAIDINPEMVEEGRKIAREKDVKNIIWRTLAAEEISQKLGMFQIVTIGAAFHWMNGDTVLKQAYEVTIPGGGIAIVDNINSLHRDNNGSLWKQTALKIIEKHAGRKRLAGKSVYPKSKDHFENIIDRSGYVERSIFTRKYAERWTIDQIIGYLHSTSFASQEVLGDRWEPFEKEIRDVLKRINSSGVFLENQTLKAIFAKKR